MLEAEDHSHLTAAEKALKERFHGEGGDRQRVQSTARAAATSTRVDQLALPDELRGAMPFTKDKYLVKENAELVQWERETRKFLRRLSPRHRHRVSAVMIWEWVTGLSMAELVANGGSANADLRKLNQILNFYFGKSYSTYIMGRKVPKCYNVKPGYLIKRHRPMTLTLLAEYYEKTLNP
jgi:hypothetical protein